MNLRITQILDTDNGLIAKLEIRSVSTDVTPLFSTSIPIEKGSTPVQEVIDELRDTVREVARQTKRSAGLTTTTAEISRWSTAIRAALEGFTEDI